MRGPAAPESLYRRTGVGLGDPVAAGPVPALGLLLLDALHDPFVFVVVAVAGAQATAVRLSVAGCDSGELNRRRPRRVSPYGPIPLEERVYQ